MGVIRRLGRRLLEVPGAALSLRMEQTNILLEQAKILSAKSLVWQSRSFGALPRISDAEFQVFSQFGDDGIIQYLIRHLHIRETSFVEFGVGLYSEANTRFLLMNDNWRGLVMDSAPELVGHLQSQELYWKYDLTAVSTFIDRDNINGLIQENGFSGEIGLLSIDIDGNDYWVWEQISIVRPVLVVAEYNSLFGMHRPVSIPYDPRFNRTRAHYSNQYWGCSLAALTILAERKGYAFVGCNSNGNNAYFALRDRLGSLKPIEAKDGFVLSRFRDSRDHKGNLTFLSGDSRRQVIADQHVVDVVTGDKVLIGNLA